MAFQIVMILIIIKAVYGASIEPICSKFSYEEQMLEKMVRLEFFAENIQKNVKTSIENSANEINGMTDKQKEMSNSITNFSENMEHFGRQFRELEANLKETTNTTLEELIENVKVKFEEFKTNITITNAKILKEMTEESLKNEQKLDRFMTNITNSNQKILEQIRKEMENSDKKIGEEVKKKVTDMQNQNLKATEDLIKKKFPLVAFNVYSTDEDYTGTTVPFKKIRQNEGDGFSTDTYQFTAPVSGFYQFNAHICIEKGHEIDYYIYVAGVKYARGEYVVPNAASDGKCLSFSTVALVRESQTAYVGGISSEKSFVNNDDLNSFSGVLVRPI